MNGISEAQKRMGELAVKELMDRVLRFFKMEAVNLSVVIDEKQIQSSGNDYNATTRDPDLPQGYKSGKRLSVTVMAAPPSDYQNERTDYTQNKKLFHINVDSFPDEYGNTSLENTISKAVQSALGGSFYSLSDTIADGIRKSKE